MPEWQALRHSTAEFPALNPTVGDSRESVNIPAGSVTDSKIQGVSALKISSYGIKVYRSTDQTGIVTATDTSVTFNTVDFNRGFTTPGATFTTVTIPVTGVYLFTAQTEFTITGVAADFAAWCYLNGAKAEGNSSRSDTIRPRRQVHAQRKLRAGDTVGLRVRQETGANRSLQGGMDDLSMTVSFMYVV